MASSSIIRFFPGESVPFFITHKCAAGESGRPVFEIAGRGNRPSNSPVVKGTYYGTEYLSA